MNCKTLNKQYGGAILLEALLVMGVLMMSMPVIIQQMQRRNETVENLVISEEIKTVQNAASGFVIFEKDNLLETYFPDESCDTKELSYNMILPHLQQYGFPTSFYENPKYNPLGLKHSLILYCHREGSSSRVMKGYVVSRIGTYSNLSSIKTNEILNLLGWNAAFIEHDEELGVFVVSNLPEYKLPNDVKSMIGVNAFVISLESQRNFGDYMAKMIVNNDETHNTMMTELDMNNNNINCISDISGYEMRLLDPNGWNIKYLKTKDLTARTLRGENLKYHSYNREYGDGLLIETPKLHATDINAYSITAKTFETHGFVNVKGDLYTSALQINGIGNIGELGFTKSIDVDVLKLINLDNTGNLLPVSAKGYNIMNAIIVTGSDNVIDNIENPKARISLGDKSTIVKDIKRPNGDGGMLAEELYKQVNVIKTIVNEAAVTWQ